jgi:hypothetical protein
MWVRKITAATGTLPYNHDRDNMGVLGIYLPGRTSLRLFGLGTEVGKFTYRAS